MDQCHHHPHQIIKESPVGLMAGSLKGKTAVCFFKADVRLVRILLPALCLGGDFEVNQIKQETVKGNSTDFKYSVQFTIMYSTVLLSQGKQ